MLQIHNTANITKPIPDKFPSMHVRNQSQYTLIINVRCSSLLQRYKSEIYKTKVQEICLPQNLCGTPRHLKNRTVLGKMGCMGTLLICHMFGVPPSGICKCITTASQFKPDKE